MFYMKNVHQHVYFGLVKIFDLVVKEKKEILLDNQSLARITFRIHDRIFHACISYAYRKYVYQEHGGLILRCITQDPRDKS